MTENRESSQEENGTHLPNAYISDLKSAHTVVVTQPSENLNTYVVDKFPPPTSLAIPALFGSIDLSIHQASESV